jgi:hypothetical protein
MADMQLQHLNRSRVNALKKDEYCLRLEPVSISRKKLGKMRPGDWIDLGEEPPALEVARDGLKIAPAYPLEEGIRIGAPEENPRRPFCEPKRIVLEGRLAVLPTSRLAPGESLELSRPVTERIYLYDPEGGLRAVARLIAHEKGYALEILELGDG